MRIFEKINVVDETGAVVHTFTREMDPRFYVWMNIPPEAESITRVRLLSKAEAELAWNEDGALPDNSPAPTTAPESAS